MRIRRIEHVAIAVRDLERSRAFWEGVLGIRLEAEEDMPSAQVRIGLYPVGESMVELIAGTTSQSTYQQLVQEKDGLLHHICLEVDDIEQALAELRAKGIRLRDEVPRAGHQGSRIAFLDPGSTGHVLIELVEPKRTSEPTCEHGTIDSCVSNVLSSGWEDTDAPIRKPGGA